MANIVNLNIPINLLQMNANTMNFPNNKVICII
jgi:hypothetical protein